MPVRVRQLEVWTTDASDEELVVWAQQGHREAFGLLYDRHVASIFGYCYRRLGERETAQDAVAETFRNALIALPAYQPVAFHAWLFAIARNVVIDAVRRQRRDLPLDDVLDVPDGSAPLEDTAATRADLASLMAVLPHLTADQQDAVALRLAGLTPAEIGAVLGKSRGAVDMTLHRALVRLRGLMTGETRPLNGDGNRG